MKGLNPGSGPRAKGCVSRSQALAAADFLSRLIRTSFIQLLLSCSFVMNAKAGRYVTRTPVNSAKYFYLLSYLDIPKSINLLCSAFINCETKDCNPGNYGVWRETRLCN